MLHSASAAVFPIPAVDTQPLTFHRSKPRLDTVGHATHHARSGIVATASVDEMRELLDLLNGAESTDRAAAAAAAAYEAAEKRRKHREAMVLFRLRKKVNFGDMKQQEQSLQDVLQLKLKAYHALRDRRDAVSATTQDEATLRTLQDEFAEILTMKESLLRENRAMEGVISELTKFQKLVKDEADRQSEEEEKQTSFPSDEASISDASAPDTKPAAAHPAGQWIHLVEGEAPVYYVLEPQANSAVLARSSFQRAQQLRSDFVNKRFEITETFCFGWHAQHSLVWTTDHTPVLRFRFTRQVPRWFMSLADYRRVAWHAVSTPDVNVKLYSTPVHVKVTQWLNDDTFVTLRSSPHRDRSVNFRYFASNSQVEYRDDQDRRTYMIHHTILDRPSPVQAAPEQPIIWIKEGSQCMKFTEMEQNDTIEIDHCGYMNCVSEEQARYLMIETCSILMRWEQMVVPRRMLTAE